MSVNLRMVYLEDALRYLWRVKEAPNRLSGDLYAAWAAKALRAAGEASLADNVEEARGLANSALFGDAWNDVRKLVE
jgi:hypothetical protein